MTEAATRNSTPRTDSPTYERNLDLAYRRLEDRVNDLDRLSEIATELSHDVIQKPDDRRRGDLAAAMADVVQDHVRELKATYYAWYHSPPSDDHSTRLAPRRAGEEA